MRKHRMVLGGRRLNYLKIETLETRHLLASTFELLSGQTDGVGDDGLDFGDAPDPTYPTLLASGGANHLIIPNGPLLGFLIDAEPDGQPDPVAQGDDLAGLPDEDGVNFTSPILIGSVATVDVFNGGASGRLNGLDRF